VIRWTGDDGKVSSTSTRGSVHILAHNVGMAARPRYERARERIRLVSSVIWL